jgi:two-component system sensor histidine kinase KdpD
MTTSGRQPDVTHLIVALSSIAAITAIYFEWLHVTNATTVALSYLLVVLFVAASSRMWVAVTTSLVAMLCFNFFSLPPVGTLTIADPQNWVALFAFLAVGLVASRLSSLARDRQREALARRDEVSRLFDLSRDILVTTEDADAIPALARHIARRFHLDYVAICLPTADDFERFETGALDLQRTPSTADLRRALSTAERTIELHARERAAVGDEAIGTTTPHPVRLVPLRLGTRVIGLLATAGRPFGPGTLDTLASVAAIAIERTHFLEERKRAELSQRSAELKSALIASLAHNLRTPLTAIRVAADNLRATWLTEAQAEEQTDIVLSEVERLTRLFQNILEMTTIDAGAVASNPQWVHPLEIIEAAQGQVEYTLRGHNIDVPEGSDDRIVHVDPGLTSAALAHLLENAAQYSPPGSTITVAHEVTAEGLRMTVLDRGAGIAPSDLPHLFDRYYRGGEARRHRSGSGMGLSIARGLLAEARGRAWAENRPDGGAQFSIFVPGDNRPVAVAPE